MNDSPDPAGLSTGRGFPLLVHCHLGWNWVWQRPQQFMSRLAQRHPVLFVETHPPIPDIDEPQATLRDSGTPGVTILKIKFPLSRWHDAEFVDSERRRLVQETIATERPEFLHPVQWFYDPMTVTAFAGHMNERINVYDCMDELSQFKGAPREIINRERELLAEAAVVFAGGRKMWESKSRYNGNCHFYGCGVDIAHFGQARRSSTAIADDLQSIPEPRIGYVGVIDERLDYALLREVAEQQPDWHFVMVGPVCKVDESELPRLPNIHWMGGRDYKQLPHYLKGFDICMMPFALNEATEYINPTKTLEYLAAGKPVVSTPVEDVVRNFGNLVYIGDSAGAFAEHCRTALESPDELRRERGIEAAEAQTWDRIVDELERHIEDALAAKAALNGKDVVGSGTTNTQTIRNTNVAG